MADHWSPGGSSQKKQALNWQKSSFKFQTRTNFFATPIVGIKTKSWKNYNWPVTGNSPKVVQSWFNVERISSQPEQRFQGWSLPKTDTLNITQTSKTGFPSCLLYSSSLALMRATEAREPPSEQRSFDKNKWLLNHSTQNLSILSYLALR